MTIMEPLYLYGCRHDILGHYLKTIGLLRTLSQCADEKRCDPEAEGWWDLERGCFCLRSEKYSTKEDLTQFFAVYYRPTVVFAAWNKEPGISKEIAGKIGYGDGWELANSFSKRIVTPREKQNSVNKDKLISEEAFRAYREKSMDSVSIALDAVSNAHSSYRGDNPLFLMKGIAGRAHLWRNFWKYVSRFENLKTQKKREPFVVLIETSVFGQTAPDLKSIRAKGKGTPFFPDAIKSYNIGSKWVMENYPFNPLDYILAFEGAFAMRGSVARTLAPNSKRFEAFPFVFDSCEDMVDDANKVKGTANALWFPLWDRPTTFSELSSFISDAQTRLPGKEARFSAEFVRALNAQGVDAGFSGWQEFRFKMKASRVPWITTGRYVKTAFRAKATRLNRALYPLDESHFFDQFKFKWNGSNASSRSPHTWRTKINEAMENAVHEPTAIHCLNLLGAIFHTCRQIAVSKSFREDLSDKRGIFFRPLPAKYWNEIFADFDEPEFRIARALASISGLERQRDGTNSKSLPMLGSILPLKLGARGWYLPKKEDLSNQAVWSGSNLCHDLAAVLARRYMDSLGDDRPALLSKHGAPLNHVLAFLRGELDDQLIARWTESLSLIGWKFSNREQSLGEEEEALPAIPPEYAALRTLLELECEWQKEDEIKKRRSQQPVSLLCQRSSSLLPFSVSEALRWIAIWGIPNPYRDGAEPEKKRLTGRDIIHLDTTGLSFSTDAARLAAAVCIPLHWRDRHKLFKAVSLPKPTEFQ